MGVYSLEESDGSALLGDYTGIKNMAWTTTKYTGVRYREHAARKQKNGQPDRYFTVRYYPKVGDNKRIEEPVGWATSDWTAEKVHGLLSVVKENIAKGEGPQTLAAIRKENAGRRKAEAKQEEAEKAARFPLRDFLEAHYMPVAKREKRSWKTDEQRIEKEINPVLGDIPLLAIKPSRIQNFINALQDEGFAASTVKQYLGIVCKALTIALGTYVNGVRVFSGQNPASQRGLRVPKVRNSRDRYFTAKEMKDTYPFFLTK